MYRDKLQCLKSQKTVGVFLLKFEKYMYILLKVKTELVLHTDHKKMTAHMDSNTSDILLHCVPFNVFLMQMLIYFSPSYNV